MISNTTGCVYKRERAITAIRLQCRLSGSPRSSDLEIAAGVPHPRQHG
jgi:hypothetical protein